MKEKIAEILTKYVVDDEEYSWAIGEYIPEKNIEKIVEEIYKEILNSKKESYY